MDKLTVIASKRNWIDSRSVETLENITHFKGVKKVVGLPDLSVGRVPNGMAVLTENRIYPHLIGGDIGCGMSLYQVANSKKIKVDKFEKKLRKIESLDDIPMDEGYNVGYNIGSIGKGNHFAELHVVHEVKCASTFAHYKLNEKALYTLVHSGSRAFGQIVFDAVAGKYDPSEGMDSNSKEAEAYLKKHDKAINYAKMSRKIISKKLIKAIGINSHCHLVSDTAHNSILQTKEGWLHRKGATPMDKGLVIIAGSRGSLSYLVKPTEQTELSSNSLAHGAGRKWERSSAEAKLRNRYSYKDLQRSEIGSRVLCADKKLLYEEASQAYKNIDIVIDDLVEAGLATVVATFRPILTYKE